MSNHLAVAAVTATLVDVLRSAVQNDVTGAEIKPSRPENGGDDGDSPEVRVFLYRVEPNAAWRNDDLPMRTNDGSTMINRPQAALTLNYLFAFSGDEASWSRNGYLVASSGASTPGRFSNATTSRG